jgi:hypothetical protein
LKGQGDLLFVLDDQEIHATDLMQRWMLSPARGFRH